MAMDLILYLQILLFLSQAGHGETAPQTSEAQLESGIRFPDHFPVMFDEESNRIIGGQDAGLHEFPSIISLQYDRHNIHVYNHTCTGSIINENWMVTAGHCSDIGPASRYRAVAGAHNLYSYTGSEQIRGLQAIIPHPWLSLISTPDYDIAMMMFNSPLSFTEAVTPVALASKGFVPSGTGVASGWGITRENATAVPATLQTITLPIENWKRCHNMYVGVGLNLTPRFLCAGGQAGRNVCHGDSGGPFYVNVNGNPLTMTGLTSWSVGCALQGFPAAFTDAAYLHNWITCVSKFKGSLTRLQNSHCAAFGY